VREVREVREVMVMMVLNGARTVVSTLAGGVNGNQPAFADASGINAGFNFPFGVAVDASGNVFVGDRHNHRIREVTAGGGTHADRPCRCNICRVLVVVALSSLTPPSSLPSFPLFRSPFFKCRFPSSSLRVFCFFCLL
jgi:hypothetical protein